MNRKLKTVLCAALVLLLMFSCCCVSFADEPMPVTVKAKAAVLMDVDSGKVLMSMNADEKLYPAWLESTIDKVDRILKDKPHTFVQPKLNLKNDFTFN